MGVMAQWGPMIFQVNAKQITPITGFTTGFKMKADSNSDTSGTKATNTRGKELETVKFEVKYMTAAGNYVRGAIGQWRELVGKVNVFSVGGRAFGAANFQLDEVTVNDTILDVKGNFISAVIGITLTEYVPQEAKKTATTATSAKGGTAAKQTATTASKTAAMSAKPTKQNKQEKSPYQNNIEKKKAANAHAKSIKE